MAFLTNIDQVRAVQWGQKYLWDLKIDDTSLPSPYDSWFPASEIDEELGHIDSYQFDANIGSFKLPQKTLPLHLKISFYDDDNTTLASWLDNWINDLILNNQQYISTLETAVKLVHVLKLDIQRNTAIQNDYYVYPEGTLTWNGTNESGVQIFTQNFVIVSRVNQHITVDIAAGGSAE